MRVLLVEEESELAGTIKRVLYQEAYIVDWVRDGIQAWKYLENDWTEYTLGIFDWLLPGLSGLELVKRLRGKNNFLPVLMLAAPNEKVSLDNTVNDYLVKPFAMTELLARMRTLQGSLLQMQRSQLRLGDLTLDYNSKSICLSKEGTPKIILTVKEFQLLEYFMRHPCQIVTTEQLLTQLWELDAEPMSNVVAAQVRLLRRKLRSIECDRVLETVFGLGYHFNPKC
jgi:DNA-binding response OmpR family regulator